jgi:hypothetical protein
VGEVGRAMGIPGLAGVSGQSTRAWPWYCVAFRIRSLRSPMRTTEEVDLRGEWLLRVWRWKQTDLPALSVGNFQ